MSADKAGGRHLAGDLGDADRPAELIGGFTPGKDPADVGQGAVDHEPGLLRAHDDGRQRPDLLRLDVAGRHGAADAEHAEPVHIAEIVLDLLELAASP